MKVAAAAAVIIVFIVGIVGAFLILTSGAPKEDLSWTPVLTPYVDDRAGVLDYDEYLELDYFCYQVESVNTCQIAVLTVNSTQPIGINDFAVKTFERNGIGQEGRDNGVLFVFSHSERAWRVVTGAGVSDILSGSKLTDLRQNISLDEQFEAGNFSAGISDYIHAIGEELVDRYDPDASKGDYPISWIPLRTWHWYVVIGVMMALIVITRGMILIWIPQIILALLSGGRGGWGGGGTGGGGARGRF